MCRRNGRYCAEGTIGDGRVCCRGFALGLFSMARVCSVREVVGKVDTAMLMGIVLVVLGGCLTLLGAEGG